MSHAITIRIITRRELAERSVPEGLDDPYAVLDTEPDHRATLLANPLSCEPGDPVRILAVSGRTIAGRIDLIPGRIVLLKADGTADFVPVLWGSSWYVPPEFRKTLAAVMIIMRWQALWPAAAVVGVSRMALPMYEKLKWTSVPMHRSVLLFRSRAIVERYAGTGFWARTVRCVADFGLRMLNAVHRLWRPSARRLRVERIDRAPEHWGPLLARCGRDHPASTVRSVEWLNWLLGNTFGGRLKARTGLFAVRESSGRDMGYFLIKDRLYESATAREFKNLQLGTVSDWATFEPERLQPLDLIALAVRELRRLRIDAAEVCSNDQALHRRLRRVGFIGAGQLAFLFRSPPGGPLGADALRSETAWSVRPADGDNFFA